MPRACTVCEHPDRAQIDGAIIRRRPHRETAKRFGVSRSAISRHSNHLDRSASTPIVSQPTLPEPSQTGLTRNLPDPVESSAPLLAQLHYLQDHTLHLLERASAERQTSTALKAIKEARANVETMAKLTGQWVDRQAIQGTVTHELGDLDVPALRAKLKELEQDLEAIDTEGVTQ